MQLQRRDSARHRQKQIKQQQQQKLAAALHRLRSPLYRKSRAARHIYSTGSNEHHPADERIKKADRVHGQRFAGRHEDIRQKTGGGARTPAAAQDDTARPKDETNFAYKWRVSRAVRRGGNNGGT